MLYAATSAVLWAILHARAFEHDVVESGECGGRLRVGEVIVDPAVASKIVASISRRDGFVGSADRGPPRAQLAIAWSTAERMEGMGASGVCGSDVNFAKLRGAYFWLTWFQGRAMGAGMSEGSGDSYLHVVIVP